MERAENRDVPQYSEKHRIVPGCLGGTYDKGNVVRLSPEEHFIAHQLLVKIYPENGRLVYAALMMTVKSSNTHRYNNKAYGWLKRKYNEICKKRTGKSNPSFGRSWYHCPITLKNGKFREDEVPVSWVKGRTPKKKCKLCGRVVDGGREANYCVKHREQRLKRRKIHATRNLVGNAERRFEERKEVFLSYIKEGHSFDASLKKVGYKNYNMKAGVGPRAQALLDEHGIQRPLSPKRPPKASA